MIPYRLERWPRRLYRKLRTCLLKVTTIRVSDRLADTARTWGGRPSTHQALNFGGTIAGESGIIGHLALITCSMSSGSQALLTRGSGQHSWVGANTQVLRACLGVAAEISFQL